MRHFTLFCGGPCQSEGCLKLGDQLGFCRYHYSEKIARAWHALRVDGRTQPTPTCFDDPMRWMEYEVHWHDTTRAKADPCRDCTPEYRAQKVARGLCEHPETVFVESEGETVGYNFNRIDDYMRACSGLKGRVIHILPAEERERLLGERK